MSVRSVSGELLPTYPDILRQISHSQKILRLFSTDRKTWEFPPNIKFDTKPGREKLEESKVISLDLTKLATTAMMMQRLSTASHASRQNSSFASGS
jgi:hypothetical protein